MKRILSTIAFTLFSVFSMSAQSVLGVWKTIDDNTGDPKSMVEIYKDSEGKVHGKILKIFNPEKKGLLCTECTGEDKDIPVEGMVFIRNLEKDGDEFNGGIIINPENGSAYKCYIKLTAPDNLKIRAYVGVPVIGRTQHWLRVN